MSTPSIVRLPGATDSVRVNALGADDEKSVPTSDVSVEQYLRSDPESIYGSEAVKLSPQLFRTDRHLTCDN